MKRICLFLVILVGINLQPASAETVNLSTYYPAPFGVYDRLRLVPKPGPLDVPCQVGTLSVLAPDLLQYCADVGGLPTWTFPTGVWTQNNLSPTNATIYPSDTVRAIRLGIGTTAPTSNLEIFQTRNAADITMLKLTTAGTGAIGDRLNLLFSQPATGGALRNVAQISAIHNSPTNNLGNLAFSTSIAGVLTEQMRIDSDGNVGIATTAPGYELDVAGTTRAVGLITTSANAARYVAGNFGMIERQDGTNFYHLLTASGDQYGSWNTLRPFRLNLASGDVFMGNNTLTIKHGGNVGISRTAPAFKLHVAGAIGQTRGGNTGEVMVRWRSNGYYAVYAP